jgi:hypothetical protein
MGPAEPVDRTITAYQRCCLTITNQGVVFDVQGHDDVCNRIVRQPHLCRYSGEDATTRIFSSRLLYEIKSLSQSKPKRRLRFQDAGSLRRRLVIGCDFLIDRRECASLSITQPSPLQAICDARRRASHLVHGSQRFSLSPTPTFAIVRADRRP